MNDAPLFMMENVSLSFGGLKAVAGFDLSLSSGQLHGLIGPNGAGKTTVFNLITGVYTPDSGRISLAGRRIEGMASWRIARVGVARTFQNIRLFPDLTVLDNVMVACHLRARHNILHTLLRTERYYADEHDMIRRSRALLEVIGLQDRQWELACNLPYGDQRRLEIARALATGPKLLLLDEPAAGLNTGEKKALTHLIRDLRTRFELTILLIDHDMALVMDLCEGITVLDYGQIIATGTPSQVQCNSRVIEAYLGQSAEC